MQKPSGIERWLIGLLFLGGGLSLGCTKDPYHRFGGYLESEAIEVGSRVGGRVKSVLVEEGTEVEPGQLLVRFETEHLEAELNEAKERAKRLKFELDKAENGPRPQEIEQAYQQFRAAETKFHEAERRLARVKEVAGTFTDEEIDQRRTDREIAAAERAAARQKWELLREGTRAEDLAIARHAWDEAKYAVLRLKDLLEEGEVRAPVAAVVEAFDLEPGDLVAGGSPVATLIRKDELWVRAFVPATLLTRVHPGDEVKVEVDSRDELFEGVVQRVNRQAEFTPRNVQTYQQREDQVFGIKVLIRDPQHKLRPGMAATVLVPKPDKQLP